MYGLGAKIITPKKLFRVVMILYGLNFLAIKEHIVKCLAITRTKARSGEI